MRLRTRLGRLGVTSGLALALFGVFLTADGICIEGGTTDGAPYVFYSQCNDVGPTGLVPGDPVFRPAALVADLAIWHLVAAVLVFLFLKARPAEADRG